MGLGIVGLLAALALGDLKAPCVLSLRNFTVEQTEEVVVDFSSKAAANKSVSNPVFSSGKFAAVQTRWGIVELGKKIGEGKFGRVFRLKSHPDWVIKIPINIDGVWEIGDEVQSVEKFKKAGIPIPEIFDSREGDVLMLKAFVDGVSLKEIQEGDGLSDDQLASMVDLFLKAYRAELVIDLQDPSNLIFSAKQKSFVVLDISAPISMSGFGSKLNIQAWKNSTRKRSDEFITAVTKVLGAEVIEDLERLSVRQAGLLHAVHHDPILGAFGF